MKKVYSSPITEVYEAGLISSIADTTSRMEDTVSGTVGSDDEDEGDGSRAKGVGYEGWNAWE